MCETIANPRLIPRSALKRSPINKAREVEPYYLLFPLILTDLSVLRLSLSQQLDHGLMTVAQLEEVEEILREKTAWVVGETGYHRPDGSIGWLQVSA